MSTKPILGILLGDSSGVGPELVAKLAASNFYQNYCRPVIIGDIRILNQALSIIHADAPLTSIDKVADADWSKGTPVLDQRDQDPDQVIVGQASTYCGAAVYNALKVAAKLFKDGDIEGFCFAPFNKAALKMGGCGFESEHYLLADIFGCADQPFGEINVVDNLWTSRTTSHVPIKEVSDHLTVDSVLRAELLCYNTLKQAGYENPRLGVAALNPHAGENGL